MVEPLTEPTTRTGAEPETDRITWEWKLAGVTADAALAKTKVDGGPGRGGERPRHRRGRSGRRAGRLRSGRSRRRATLVLEDGTRADVLEFGRNREAEGDRPAGTWMRVQGEPTVWVVTEYAVNNIFKRVDDLLADLPAGVRPNVVSTSEKGPHGGLFRPLRISFPAVVC